MNIIEYDIIPLPIAQLLIFSKINYFLDIFATMKKIAFILNPISGTGHKEKIISYLHQIFDGNKEYDAVFHTTTSAEDAYESSHKFAQQQYDIVVAIGGDGTVNQIARGLLYTKTKLAVIPVGSGNGLARHLRIPLSYHSAVDAILEGNAISIDAGKINDKRKKLSQPLAPAKNNFSRGFELCLKSPYFPKSILYATDFSSPFSL